MPVPETLTYDIPGAPRRPSLEDVGGATMEDDQARPPDPVTMPTAAKFNQHDRQIAAAHRVLPVLVLSLRFSSGAPIIDSFTTLSTLPVTGTFTVVDNGTGDTSITWPANTFPTPAVKPKGGVNGPTLGACAPELITNGVRIRTVNMSNVATDLPCTVEVW